MNVSKKYRWIGRLAAVAMFAIGATACGSDEGDKTTAEGGTLVVDPTPVLFTEVDLGSRATLDVVLTNSATNGSLSINGVRLVEDTLDDPAGNEILRGETWFTTAQLGPGETKTLQVVYAPNDQNTDNGRIELDVVGDDTITGVFEIPIQTAGIAPDISTPEVVRFPRIAPVTEETLDQAFRTQQVQNIGGAPLSVESIILTGSADYKIRFYTEDPGMEAIDGSETWPTEVTPGGSFWYRLYFNPDDPLPSTAEVSFFTNDPDNGIFVVDVEGNSDSPCLEFSNEDEINFGQGGIGYANTKTVTIRNCGQSAKLEVQDLAITDDGGGVFKIKTDTLPEALQNGEILTLDPAERINFVVTYEPTDETQSTGELMIRSNDASKSELLVPILGRGTDNVCPTAIAQGTVAGSPQPQTTIATIPQEVISLDGTQSFDQDGSIVRYEWSIISQPQGSEGVRLLPSADVPEPTIAVDAAGTYVIELTVFDDGGVASCGDPARVTITAIPQEDIHIQLVWNTPLDQNLNDDSGTDLDLHFLHPLGQWNTPPYDIFWDNARADWGPPGPTGDPALDLDDTNGAGPENINMSGLETSLTYAIGVYYYNAGSFGASYATVRVYVRGTLSFEYRDVFLAGRGDFWYVATLSWPSGQVVARDEIRQGFP